MTVSTDVRIDDGSTFHGPEPSAQASQKPPGRLVLATFQAKLRCNSACGYCDLPLNVGRYEMTRGEIRCVFSYLYREGVQFVLLQGGEPLLRRDVPEILEDLSAIGFHLTLITNGTKITPQLVERLGRLQVAISVTLDTLDRVK